MDTIDITGYHLHTESDEEFIMILKGTLADILVNIYPNVYSKYVVLEKGVKVLYVNLKEAQCGLLRNDLLVYLKLETELKIMVLS